MIKYGVLDEYKCNQCGETISVPQHTILEELSKFASEGECSHSWEKLKKIEVEQESPEE